MQHYIKPIFIYLLIIFFMYVILLQETIIEGRSVAARIRDRLKKAANTVGDAARDAADKAREAAERAAAEAERIAREAAAAAQRILEAAIKAILDGILSSVTSIDRNFTLASQKLSEITNKSDNLEKDVNAQLGVVNSANSGSYSGANSGSYSGASSATQ